MKMKDAIFFNIFNLGEIYSKNISIATFFSKCNVVRVYSRIDLNTTKLRNFFENCL